MAAILNMVDVRGARRFAAFTDEERREMGLGLQAAGHQHDVNGEVTRALVCFYMAIEIFAVLGDHERVSTLNDICASLHSATVTR